MEIRKLTEKDITSINKLQTELGYKEISKIHGWMYGAFQKKELVGIVGVFPYRRLPHKDYPNGYIAEIGALYVKDSFRRMGIATKLLQFAMEKTANKGLDAYVIDCTKDSYRIFKSLGFEESTEYRMWKQNKFYNRKKIFKTVCSPSC